MRNEDRLVVPLSRMKLSIYAVGCLVLAIGSLLPFLGNYTGYTPHFGLSVTISGFILFGAGAYFCLKKLFDVRPGLVLDENGVVDNSNIFRSRSAEWSNVSDIRMFWGRAGRSLTLRLDCPVREGPLFRVMTISPNMLKIGFGDLERAVRSYWQKYGRGVRRE